MGQNLRMVTGAASQIFQGLAGQILRLRWGTVRRKSYRPTPRDAGFFSLCSSSLADLAQLERQIRRIVANRAFRRFRALPGGNTWSLFFQQPENTGFGLGRLDYVATLVKKGLYHTNYSTLDFFAFAPFVRTYFTPSTKVQNKTKEFEKRYGLSPWNLIAVNIRGTDKWKEIPAADVDRYIQLAENAASEAPHAKILLVTDQHQFLSLFEARFADRLVVIRELPTTSRIDGPIHNALTLWQRRDFGVNFLAVVLLMASSRIVITHTGNTAFWTVLFRGHTNGLVQLRGEETFGEIKN